MHKGKKADDIDKHVLGKVRVQNFNQRLADDAVKVNKMKIAQEKCKPVLCKNIKLENVFSFKYLGTLFTADGNQIFDIKRRIALAMTQCGKLKHIFNSPVISLRLKLRLYDAAICSICLLYTSPSPRD